MIKPKHRLKSTRYLSYLLLVVCFGVAALSSVDLLSTILIISEIVGGIGVLCCIITAFVHPKPLTNAMLQTVILQKSHFKTKQMYRLWLGQIIFVCMSFVLFHFLETQTQINTRLSLVETGYIKEVWQQQPFDLGLLPFVIYGVLGLGLAYFSICLGEKPILMRAFAFKWAFSLTHIRQPTAKFVLFCQNCIYSIIEIAITLSLVFMTTFALFWFCETVNTCLGWDSLFKVPLRTLFILGLMMLVFPKINKQLMTWMRENHISVGQILMIYILAFGSFLLWLHAASDWLTLTISGSLPNSEKSYFSGILNEKSLKIRIQYLIWGWWGIWTPWMVSLVARAAIGCSIPRAFIQALVLPVIVFALGMRYQALINWNLIYTWLQLPVMQLFVLFAIFFCIWTICRRMQTMGDVLKGAMLSTRRVSNRSLNRWMTVLIFWLTCYIPSQFILGWLPMQFILSFSGLLMSVAVVVFIGIWGMMLYRGSDTSESIRACSKTVEEIL